MPQMVSAAWLLVFVFMWSVFSLLLVLIWWNGKSKYNF